MRNQGTNEKKVQGGFAEIQFEDEGGKTVGVGPVSVRFLERFSGHVSCLQFRFRDVDNSPRLVQLKNLPTAPILTFSYFISYS